VRELVGAPQPVEDVAAQRVTYRQARVVEVLRGIARHPEFLHHAS
jgi:hypothetical protein